MKNSENFSLSVQGFSAKRMAYLLTFLATLLLPFHSIADYRGDEYLTAMACALMITRVNPWIFRSQSRQEQTLAFRAGASCLCLSFLFLQAMREPPHTKTHTICG
jgi:hypothetical protein